MVVTTSAQRQGAWSAALKRHYGLRLSRGEVVVADSTLHAVVGFDGQLDAYQCWIRQTPCTFDTTVLVPLSRKKAHYALRDVGAKDQLPPLPLIDDNGLVVSTLPIEDTAKMQEKQHSHPSEEDETSPLQQKRVPINHIISTPPGAVSMLGSDDDLIPNANLFRPEPPPKVCFLCAALHSLVIRVSSNFAHLSNLLRATRSIDGHSSPPASRSKSKNVANMEEPRPLEFPLLPGRQSPPRLPLVHITVPILRPMTWQDVEPFLKNRALTFDERGIKETMTVEADRWSMFVERQRKRLRQELVSARRHRHRDALLARGNVMEDDLVELEMLLERMEDWKDLRRYAGKSIGMAAARCGAEMHLLVLAFEQRADCAGIDFVRLAYRKSVEVRNQQPLLAGRPSSAAWALINAMIPCLMAPASITEKQLEQWVELLQRPDVAKFVIALFFRSALASDGVHFEFCDPTPTATKV